ncbi:hypothetical protein MBLNU13_g05249t1 [Cladosporium sp. NU13]
MAAATALKTPAAPSLHASIAKGKETQTSPSAQATPLPLQEPGGSTGAQDMSAEAYHQLVQGDGDDEQGENSTKLLKQTVPSRREDGEGSTGGTSAESVAHISESQDSSPGKSSLFLGLSDPRDNLGRSWHMFPPNDTQDATASHQQDHQEILTMVLMKMSVALGQHLVGEASETAMTPAANAPTISNEAEMEDTSDSEDESIFSQASSASTATTMSLSGIRASTGNLITNLTSDLLYNKEMNAINVTALRDPGIGSERYRRNVRLLIKAFGQDLRAEAEGSTQLMAARALKTRRYAADLRRSSVVKGYHVHAKPSEHDAPSDASVNSTDEEETDEQPTEFTRIRDFLIKSKAYAAVQDRMLRFVHQPYQLRISKAVGDEAFGESGKRVDPEDLASVIEGNIMGSSPLVRHRRVISIADSDRLKGFTEYLMHGEGDW